MHDIRWIREDPNEFDRRLARRNLDEESRRRFSSTNILSIDERRRAILRVHEAALTRRKTASKENEIARRNKDEGAIKRLTDEVLELKETISKTEKEEKDAANELHELLSHIPNLPLEDVPDGVDEHGNVQRHVFGKIRNYAFNPKPHDDLGGFLGTMDFETAAKLSGARFVVLKKGLARLERAIGQFMLDLHTNEHGYAEINPPLLVRDEVMFGTGQLPKFEDDQFFAAPGSFSIERATEVLREIAIEQEIDASEHSFMKLVARINYVGAPESAKSKLAEMLESPRVRRWLIPTAEVSLTNLVTESLVGEKQLPMRYTAPTPCFRAEAGAGGRDTRG